MSYPSTAPGEWQPRANPWLIASAVMLATFMEVLDTSVANVSLAHIAGNLAVSYDDATWVLTSYLVANAVVLPITGWLGRYFGRKRFLLACVGIFTVASALCGMATSLPMLVLARIVQGAGGGALQPIAQAVLLESFPPEKRALSMSFYAMGVVVAPILGPTLGGWLTDDYSWRWVFYINLPIGILAIMMILIFLEDPPYLQRSRSGSIDYIGFLALLIWIGCLQVMLDRGQDADWFSSDFIRWLAASAAVGFVFFIVWELRSEHPIVNLGVLVDRNLAIGSFLMFVVGIILFGTTAVLPQFLQNLLGYTAFQAGLVMSPRGIGALIGSFISGRIISKVDGRKWQAGGVLLLALSMWWFGGFNLNINPSVILIPVIISGLGITNIFVPMSTFSVASIPREKMGDATGITSLLRNLGGSMGISLMTTFIARGTQVHQALLVSHLTPFNPPFRQQLSTLQSALTPLSGGTTGHHQAYAVIYSILQQQAALFSYVDMFRLLAIVCLVCIPAVLLFKKPKSRSAAALTH
jgi:MFS transporter, DHA2 family, multidrug resistance protein